MWIDRAILFFAGTAVMILQGFSYISVIAFTLAVTASCLCGYSDKKLPVILTSIVWLILSILFNDFLWMWGLFSYDISKKKVYWLYILPVASYLIWGIQYSFFTPLSLAIAIIMPIAGCVLAIKESKIQAYKDEIISNRDLSTEVELNLSRRNEQLEKEQSTEIEIATLKERGRIAMEIHDNVGHILSRAILQTGAMITTTKDADAKSNLEDLGDTLNLAMDSIRESVHGLKDEAFSLQNSIQDCIDEFPTFSCSYHFDMDNNAPKSVKQCFIVIIKEAFSNASKHSNADKIKIDLQEHPAFYKLKFTDNGSVNPMLNFKEGALSKTQSDGIMGIGLENMKERAEALGGSLNIYTDKGFAIHVVLPKK